MNTNKKYNLAILIINLFLVASTFVLVINGLCKGAGQGQLGENMYGAGYLKAFTTLSNIYCGIASFVVLVFAVNNCFEKSFLLPRWAVVFHYTSAAATGLTFITVLVFLAPMQVAMGNSYFRFFSGDMFFFHFLNPVLAAVSSVLLERKHKLGIREQLLALIPTFVYSWLYFFMVVVAKNWSDFYGFTFGGRYYMIPVSFIAMYGFTWIISLLYRNRHNALLERSGALLLKE